MFHFALPAGFDIQRVPGIEASRFFHEQGDGETAFGIGGNPFGEREDPFGIGEIEKNRAFFGKALAGGSDSAAIGYHRGNMADGSLLGSLLLTLMVIVAGIGIGGAGRRAGNGKADFKIIAGHVVSQVLAFYVIMMISGAEPGDLLFVIRVSCRSKGVGHEIKIFSGSLGIITLRIFTGGQFKGN